jgi:putative inorganic carbon (hco3(-)) transporter
VNAATARRDGGLLAVALAVTIGLAVRTGMTVAGGGSKLALLVPFAVPAVMLLAGVALRRFEWFVLLLLTARASLDTTKLSAAPASVVRADGGAPPPVHGLDPAAVIAVGFILAGVMWAAWRRSVAGPAPQPLLERALCLLIAIWSVSVIGSQLPLTSLLEAIRIFAVVLMLIVLDRLLTQPAKIRPVLAAVFASAAVPLLVAAYQAITAHGRFEAGGFSRIRATFVHPNPFALYLTFIIVMGAAIIPHVKGGARLWLAVLLAGCSVALLLTYTRTAWVCTVLGLVLIGLLEYRRLLGALFVGGLVVLLAVPSVTARFSDLTRDQRASGSAGNSLIWRFTYWTEALPLARHNPATGIGLKMVQLNTTEQKAPHNDFIRAYVETGILGFLAYLWLLLAMVRTAWAAVVRAGPGLDRGVAVGFAACVAAFLAMSLVSNVVSQVVLLWYFFAFAASAIAVSRRSPIGDEVGVLLAGAAAPAVTVGHRQDP